MQVKLFLSLLILIADYTQFLPVKRLNACQIFGWFGFWQWIWTNFRFSTHCYPQWW